MRLGLLSTLIRSNTLTAYSPNTDPFENAVDSEYTNENTICIEN